MLRSWMIISLLGMVGISSMGCQNKVHDENQALWKENRELRAKLSDTEGRLRAAPDATQMASMQQSMQQEIAARDAKIAELQNQLQQPAPGQPQDNSLQGIEVTRDDRAGTVTVNLPGDVLFDSGKADLKSTARTTLNKVVSAIKKEYSGKKILVDGYTDTDPINRTKDKWQDNLDLSAARARAVAHYLVEQGLESKSVDMRAFGDTKPRGNKSQSRRVEIVVATR
jgi:chemotaxis protein MotB